MPITPATKLTHKEMTKHIRGRLRHAGIKAKCNMYTSCGYNWIRIITPEYGAYFTKEQLGLIATIVQVNGLTFVRGVPVETEFMQAMTAKDQFDFVYA